MWLAVGCVRRWMGRSSVCYRQAHAMRQPTFAAASSACAAAAVASAACSCLSKKLWGWPTSDSCWWSFPTAACKLLVTHTHTEAAALVLAHSTCVQHQQLSSACHPALHIIGPHSVHTDRPCPSHTHYNITIAWLLHLVCTALLPHSLHEPLSPAPCPAWS